MNRSKQLTAIMNTSQKRKRWQRRLIASHNSSKEPERKKKIILRVTISWFRCLYSVLGCCKGMFKFIHHTASSHRNHVLYPYPSGTISSNATHKYSRFLSYDSLVRLNVFVHVSCEWCAANNEVWPVAFRQDKYFATWIAHDLLKPNKNKIFHFIPF